MRRVGGGARACERRAMGDGRRAGRKFGDGTSLTPSRLTSFFGTVKSVYPGPAADNLRVLRERGSMKGGVD